MAHLTLAGLSDDGKRLLLVSDKGVEFTLDIDARLRAALRGEHARLGHLEIQMDSALRPRDIQARIRAGDTPEAVAQAAQTTVDRIMAFAAPVLAERQHVAERAQRSSVRRKPGESAGATDPRRRGGRPPALPERRPRDRRLGRPPPRGRPLDPDRRLRRRQAPGIGHVHLRPPGNYVTVEDDDARWLLGEQVADRNRPARDDLKQARGRRLSAVPHEELPLGSTELGASALGDDVIEMVSEESGSLGAEQPVEAYLDDERPTRETPAVDEPATELEPRARRQSRSQLPTRSRPAARRRSGRAAPRCRAGTRSCSAGARATDPARRTAPLCAVERGVVTTAAIHYRAVVSGHVVLRHRRHRIHRPTSRSRAARPPRGRHLRPGPQGVAAADGEADPPVGHQPRHRGHR